MAEILDELIEAVLRAVPDRSRETVSKILEVAVARLNNPAFAGSTETLLDPFLERHLAERERDYALAHYEDGARW